jgi:phage repressor protein C with HTH and peptisase S24 domain
VFLYDGNTYCKLLVEAEGGLVLRSLNESYDDISVNENNVFRVLGKVVS